MTHETQVKSVDDYLSRFVPELTQRLSTELVPLYDPAKEPWNPLLARCRRKLFRAQGDAMMGLDKLLRRQKFALLVGECGVGKTLMGAGLAFLHFRDRYRAIVLCPGHLVEKWQREIEESIPGATARIVWRVSDLLEMKTRREKPTGREYLILPRDRAKLGYRRKAAYILRRRPATGKLPKDAEARRERLKRYVACPRCAEFAIDERTRSPKTPEALEARRHFCKSCGEALWEADRKGVRCYAPAEFVKRFLKGAVSLLVADEVHELKGADTAQGNVLGMLAAACRKTICLTGTLVGGYAEHLFYILYRVNAKGMREENLKYSQVQEWISRYGALEYIRKTRCEGPGLVYARGSKSHEYVRHRPGISPLAFSKHLLASSVFVELADVADQLPAFSEDVDVVPMSEDLAEAYKEIEGDLKRAMNDRSRAFKLLGTYLTTLLAYPDRPFDNDPIPDVGAPRELPKGEVYPKEEALLRFVESELAAKRRVWVFATYTATRDVTERLAALLRRRGVQAAILKQDTVEMAERERWIRDQVKRGAEVVISNPELVKTGLDLLAFPSLAFFETGYNTFTLMQASRRSWRIGQREPVKVRYFCYKATLQEAALRLMGAKVKASQALAGKFSAEGLAALTQSEDMVSALARALVKGLDGVDSAESYWRSERKAGGESQAVAEKAIAVEPVAVFAAEGEDAKTLGAPLWTLDLFGASTVPKPPLVKRPAQLELAF